MVNYIKTALRQFWQTSDRKEKVILVTGLIGVSVACIAWLSCALYIGIDATLKGLW